MQQIAQNQNQSLTKCLQRITKNLEAVVWIFCPFCREDWNKLRPCIFWWGGKKLEERICVSCAESAHSLPFVSDKYPILGVQIKLKERFRKLYGVIEGGGQKFVLTGKSYPPYIEFKRGEDEKAIWADNIFEAWSKIDFLIRNPLDETDNETAWWRKTKKS